MVQPKIQFIQGTDEQTIPDVKLTKSRDGTNGVAIFRFDQPSVFDSSGEVGDITGFYMIDEEGVLTSVDVNAKFVNGKPSSSPPLPPPPPPPPPRRRRPTAASSSSL